MALAFELGKVTVPAIRTRVLGHLAVIDGGLADAVAERLGQPGPAAESVPAVAMPPRDLPPSPALSQLASRAGGLAGRHVAALLTEGADDARLASLRRALAKAGARLTLVAQKIDGVHLADGTVQPANQALAGAPSCLFDAVLVIGSENGIAPLLTQPAALDWLRDAWRHLKAIGLDSAGTLLAHAAGVPTDEAVVMLDTSRGLDTFMQHAGKGKHHAREGAPGTDH
jgi:catalase